MPIKIRVQFTFSMAFQLISTRLISNDYLSNDWKPSGTLAATACVCVSAQQNIRLIEIVMGKL